MPDCVTHVFIADDLYNEIKPDVDYNYMVVGSQGPDPLFYYNYQPWRNTKKVPKIAGLIHHEKTKVFLDTFIRYAKTKSKKVKGFVLGFLCHYALDSTAHPYIYHVTGNYSKKNKQYRGNHLRLERGIDTILIEERGLDPRFYRVDHHFPYNTLSDELVDSFTDVMKEVYGLYDVGSLFNQGYQDFRSNFRYMVYDPLGLKKAVYSVVDLFTTGSLAYKSISFKTNVRHIDIMNRYHKIWKHPVTGAESRESFDDLFDKAKDEARVLIQKTIEYFNNGSEEIFDLTKNISYDTGLECHLSQEMTYINSIFN